MITAALLVAGGAAPADAALYAPHLAGACTLRNVTLPPDLASLCAEVLNESGNLTAVHEVMSYASAGRLCAVFPSHFPTIASALPFVRNPTALGNLVYAKLGGYAYRGDGLGELTGEGNFVRYAADVGRPLASIGDYMATPAGAADSAVWYFVASGCRGLSAHDARCRWAGLPLGATPLGLANVLRLDALLTRAMAAPAPSLPRSQA